MTPAEHAKPTTMDMDTKQDCPTKESGELPNHGIGSSGQYGTFHGKASASSQPTMDTFSEPTGEESRVKIKLLTDAVEINFLGATRNISLSEQLAKNVSKVTFPYFDPDKLKSIKLDLPFPVKQSIFLPPSPLVINKSDSCSSRPNNQLVHVSHCRKQARQARHNVLFKIGMRSHLSETRRLMAATQAGDIAKVSSILNEGVSANICDQKKRTPLHIAASQGYFAIASLLLAISGDPNSQDMLGNTPLHLAVCRGDHNLVKLLIENGANIHSQDNAGRTPLTIVKARINTLRKDRNISTDKLKTEFLNMWDFLKFHERRSSDSQTIPIGDLCHMMENISTREQADEIADLMINNMSNLCLASQPQKRTNSIKESDFALKNE